MRGVTMPTMAEQAIPRSLRAAGLFLLVALLGGLVLVVTEVGSWPVSVLILGLAAVLAGIAGLCFCVYRYSRSAGVGALRSLGRTVRVAVRLIVDLVP